MTDKQKQAVQAMGQLFNQLFTQGSVQVTPQSYSVLQDAWNEISACLQEPLTEIVEPTPSANGSTSSSSSVK